MRKSITQATLLIMILGSFVAAQNPGTLKEAETLSTQSGLPILIEFVRSD